MEITQTVLNAIKLLALNIINFSVFTDVKQTIKQLVKKSARPTKTDTRQGQVPYGPKKAPPLLTSAVVAHGRILPENN